ncbi:branched-chain amino acid ABC transporter substrate-binding protein [Uliginosibacterium sp. sgz301328]|uniref:branched-chain amino acid ABC transporter substrate-binding protein n=1 Tax=Uliginosibacterium sp. sgz301328 TaxID=3243764 RepID=UPI00359D80F4
MNKTFIAAALFAAGLGAAHAQEVVKIGSSSPLTGAQAHLGKDMQNGALLAIEDYNAKGVTIGGKKVKFELVGEDDQADPKQGTAVAQRLVDAGVKAVIGHMNSGTTIPASRIYNQAGIPMVSPSATNVTLTQQGYANVFRTMAHDGKQGPAGAKFALDKLGKKVAIIDDRTAYGQGLADEVEKTVKASGGTVTAHEFTTDKTTDFMSILTKIKAQNPDVIYFGGMDPQGGPMLKQIRQLGMNAKFMMGDGGCTPELIKLAGAAMSNLAYCTQPGVPLEQLPDRNFKDRFKKRFNADVQAYSPYAYDATSAIIEAMKAANSSEPAKYLPALKKVSFKGVTGQVSFDDKGDLKEGAISVYQFADGKWVPIK